MAIPVRRIVTGHDSQGKSIFLEDGNATNVMAPPSLAGLALTDLWESKSTPANNTGTEDAANRPFKLEPPKNGTVIRVVEFPPDTVLAKSGDIAKIFEEIGSADAKDRNNPRHQGFHKTRSLDYAIVLEGEIYAMMDEGEKLMKPGDILIQRGTNHAWSNRTDAPARICFVLIDAESIG